jgi:hypothetical protein
MRTSKFSRRHFLQSSLTAAATVAAAPIILRKDQAMANTLGTGRHTYELVNDWAKLPDGKKLGYTHGVAIDAQNRVFIFNQSADAMCIFDEGGNFIKSWNHGFEKGAHGLTLWKEGNEEFLYLCDYDVPRVCKTTLDGQIIWSLKTPPPLKDVYPNESKYKPTNVAIAPNGDIYVADGYGQSIIHQYSKETDYIRSFGSKGAGSGELNCPHGLIVDTRGAQPVLLIADRANVRLQTFSLDGKPLTTYGHENLRHPCHFDMRNGDLLIPDLHGRVTIFDKDNQLITHLGDNPGVEKVIGYPNLPKETWKPDKFISPHSACWDRKGDLYVVEWVKIGRITKMRNVNA